ncbi:MAG: 3-keto-disaccharide hydrolase [Planctomycetota bacterium]
MLPTNGCGKDLKGWYASSWSGKPTGNPDGWSVADGAIHLDCKRAASHLFSKTTFSPNVIIRLDYRAAKAADSGLCLHGKQFQLRDYPNSYPETRKYGPFSKPHGQWNALELDCTDGVAAIRLNGKVIEKAWQIGTAADRGLGLQREAGDFGFRRIRLKEKGGKTPGEKK